MTECDEDDVVKGSGAIDVCTASGTNIADVRSG